MAIKLMALDRTAATDLYPGFERDTTSTVNPAIRLLVVDDQPCVRVGLTMRLALEPDLLIVGEAGDGAAAVTAARRLRPDVVLMDAEMPRTDGIAATAELRRLVPECTVVMLSLYDDEAMRARAAAAGVAAFVAKQASEDELLAAIRQAQSPA